ncbi:MAG: CDP-diacylglycerol--serine O-phosphatidyltransferase [Vicingaceae bacterium]
MSVKKHLPNLITSLNLLCGCFAIVFIFEEEWFIAALLVLLASVFDFFDGFIARLLNVAGDMGKQMDSLADMVTFGVVPGMLVFKIVNKYALIQNFEIFAAYTWLPYLAFLIPVFSAFRLAKFNIDSRQQDQFIGLPTPANTLFFISFPIISHFQGDNSFIHPLFSQPIVLLSVSTLFSLLLVTEIPMFALKFKNFGWAENKIRYVYIMLVMVLFILFHYTAIPLSIILYILISTIIYLFKWG